MADMNDRTKGKDRGIGRRQFLGILGATAGAATLGSLTGFQSAHADTGKGAGTAFHGFRHKPNFLILMVDQERFPPLYETPEVQSWRQQNLVTQSLLRSHGMEFTRHYIGATACTPSRGTIFTGQYPSLHGVTQTTGVAKSAFDPDVFWLDPDVVPTMGDYFRAAGYRTYYRGKWHISDADIIIPGTHAHLPSYDENTGQRNPTQENIYTTADRLDDFGFTGWIGPEPHGASPRDSASSAATGVSGRDVGFADQVIELLDSLDHHWSNQPWLLVASLVNPHDIAVYGAFTANAPQLFNFAVSPGVPVIPPPPTFGENLASKPQAQDSYRVTYGQALQPIINTPFYRRLYYQLQYNVDQQLLRIFQRLQRSRFYKDTIVLFFSDHGELLGAHGGLSQKWYDAYEEVIHVNLIIHNPRLAPQYRSSDMLTSHVDLIPTMLGLAGLDAEQLRGKVARTHPEARPFVGRDLTPLVFGSGMPVGAGEPIYFMTDDDITRGLDQSNFMGWKYNSVIQPNHLETVVATIRVNGQDQLWKLTRYFDNPQFWTEPGVQDEVPPEFGTQTQVGGGIKAGECLAKVKTSPLPDEWEMYNLSADPYEAANLANDSSYAAIMSELTAILEDQRCRKRLSPSLGTVPGMPDPCA
jgi:arylsulfatase A-like enzyme